MMIDKSDRGLSFVDAALMHAQARWKDHWLNKTLQLVDWKSFSRDLDRLYSPTEGRPGWDPVVLFRCLLLAEWNGLSDRQLEEALEFRIDFKKFAGMDIDQGAPDATTFVVFRNRIQHLWKKLLRRLNAQLEDGGYSVKKAIAVDATLVEAHSKPKKDDDKRRGDPDGAWRGFPVKKNIDDEGKEIISRRMALYGYKVNLAASIAHGFVSGVSVCKASEHETNHLQEFITPETQEVYADKGYVGNREAVTAKGIKDGIMAKGTRGHPLLEVEKYRNGRIVKKRRIVEGVFGSWKQWYGWRKTKFIGIARNRLAVALTAVAWNM
jgi:IS5 family transposase